MRNSAVKSPLFQNEAPPITSGRRSDRGMKDISQSLGIGKAALFSHGGHRQVGMG